MGNFTEIQTPHHGNSCHQPGEPQPQLSNFLDEFIGLPPQHTGVDDAAAEGNERQE